MTLALVMFLLAFGIAWTQAISSQDDVTLRWLRLGDLIGMALLTIAATIVLVERSAAPADAFATTITIVAFLYATQILHIIVVQLGYRNFQRIVILTACFALSIAMILGPFLLQGTSAFPLALASAQTAAGASDWAELNAWRIASIGIAQVLSSFLLGGSLMTMLLGHAYLTAGGEMTQQPFLRLTRTLLVVIAARALLAGAAGAIPWWLHVASTGSQERLLWPAMLVITRFVVGLLVPFIMIWMAHQCVRIRSNQSATGILYVGSLMLLIGEITAVSLWSETQFAF